MGKYTCLSDKDLNAMLDTANKEMIEHALSVLPY